MMSFQGVTQCVKPSQAINAVIKANLNHQLYPELCAIPGTIPYNIVRKQRISNPCVGIMFFQGVTEFVKSCHQKQQMRLSKVNLNQQLYPNLCAIPDTNFYSYISHQLRHCYVTIFFILHLSVMLTSCSYQVRRTN